MTGTPIGSGLRLDPDLARAWAEAGLDATTLLGIGAGTSQRTGPGTARGCVVAVTPRPIEGGRLAVVDAADRFARVLGLAEVELIAVHGQTLKAVVRDWLYQAAQGSGRGVSVRLAERSDGAGLDVLVGSLDSSAREVVLRLGSEGGARAPAATALARVLGLPRVEVRLDPRQE